MVRVAPAPAPPTRALGPFGLDGGSLAFVRDGENATWRVDHPAGACALRVQRPGYQSRASIRSEVAWMEALAATGVRTPRALRTADGDVVAEVEIAGAARLVAAFAWIDGVPLGQIDGPGPWEQVGAIMAAIHDHGVRWPPPAGFERQVWDADGIVGRDGALWGDPVALGAWSADEAARLGAVRDAVHERLGALPRDDGVFGLVHGDLAFDNVIVRPDGVPVVIDFDDCGFSWHLWDLAVVLFPVDGEPAFAPRLDALLRGYRRVRELPADLLAELPTLIMARRLVTLAWLATHAGTAHAETQRPWRMRTLWPAVERYLARER